MSPVETIDVVSLPARGMAMQKQTMLN